MFQTNQPACLSKFRKDNIPFQLDEDSDPLKETLGFYLMVVRWKRLWGSHCFAEIAGVEVLLVSVFILTADDKTLKLRKNAAYHTLVLVVHQ